MFLNPVTGCIVACDSIDSLDWGRALVGGVVGATRPVGPAGCVGVFLGLVPVVVGAHCRAAFVFAGVLFD